MGHGIDPVWETLLSLPWRVPGGHWGRGLSCTLAGGWCEESVRATLHTGAALLAQSFGVPCTPFGFFHQEAASFFHLNPCFFHLLDNFPILSQVTDKMSNHQVGKAWEGQSWGQTGAEGGGGVPGGVTAVCSPVKMRQQSQRTRVSHEAWARPCALSESPDGSSCGQDAGAFHPELHVFRGAAFWVLYLGCADNLKKVLLAS